ncbi:hypothetical protein QQ045_006199 [Rhodiola kirilowii]
MQALQDSSNNSNFVKWDVTPLDDGIMQVKDEVLKAKLSEVAYAKKELKFNTMFAELLQLLHDKPLARKWLEDMDVELWTQAFDHGGYRWGNMTTYALECLN